jgi:hypothetical protein
VGEEEIEDERVARGEGSRKSSYRSCSSYRGGYYKGGGGDIE